MDLAQRKRKIHESFEARYGVAPSCWVRAPGRVDLMGSHTDYNEGFVMTLSIDRDTWIAAAPRQDDRVHVESMNLEGECEFSTRDILHQRSEHWPMYVQGVAHVLQSEGFPISPCDALVHGTVPVRGGLSSSASLEAATAVLLEELGGFQLEKLRMAVACQRAENEVVGMNCGILDQYSSILGASDSAVLLDCRHLTHEYVQFPADLRVVICNTCAPRQLTGSEYGDRRAACEQGVRVLKEISETVVALRDVTIDDLDRYEQKLSPVVARRCRFIIEENDRVHALAAAFLQNDRDAVERLSRQSFEGARDLYEISVPAMDAMIAAMRNATGVVGARQAGAGVGGCMLAFVDADQVEDFIAGAASVYEKNTQIVPQIFPVETAPGAGRVEEVLR